MTDNEFPSDVRSRIYPAESPRHRVPDPSPITDFEPWHLPRKQWVREKQWAAQIKRLIKQNGFAVDRPVRYLTLPGNDLLDVQTIGLVCAELGHDLRYLGFHSGLGTDDNIAKVSLAEEIVRSQTRIDQRSFTVDLDILSLSSERSVAWQHVKKFESFDAINLDVCDAFAGRAQRSSHLAVQRILENQLNSRRQPWLLFITSTCDSGSLPNEDIKKYLAIIHANMSRDQFAAALTLAIGSDASEALASLTNDGHNSNEAGVLAKLFSVGIGKWLSSFVLPNHWQVTMPSAACYRRSMGIGDANRVPEHPELISLVFRFEPQPLPIVDRTPFASSQPSASTAWDNLPSAGDIEEQEASSALHFADRISKIRDVDALFANDISKGEISRYVDVMSNFLADRNYDRTAYATFAQNVHPLPSTRMPD